MFKKRPVNEEKGYQKKIDELKAESLIVNSELSKLCSERDNLISEIAVYDKELIMKKNELSAVLSNIAKNDREGKEKNIRNDKQEKTINDRLKWFGLQERSFSRIADNAKKALGKKKEELDSIATDIVIAQKQLSSIRQGIDEIKPKLDEAKTTIVKTGTVKKEQDKREKDIDEKIRKNGEILTLTEKNLGKIEVWAKRLQRRYDKSGIKIDALKTFGIKRDNK